MSLMRMLAAAIGVLLVVVYAGGSGLWVQTAGAWWASLTRPSWQPPDWVFGVIWPYNFIMLGIAVVLIAQRRPAGEVLFALGAFALSVIAALAWAYLFYVPHQLTASAVALTLAAVLTVPVLIVTFRASPLVGALLTPYQVWVAVATSLAWGYAQLNR